MMQHRIKVRASLGAVVALIVATGCTTSPLGRSQLMLVDDSTMNQMGAQAFTEMQKETPVDADPEVNRYVQCVAVPITRASASKTGVSQWDIKVFDSPQVNAFALPGGKIGVYKGLLKVAKTPGQLAAVLGHETGHVIARHSAERVSASQIEGGALTAINAFVTGGKEPTGSHKLLMAALGIGAQVGIALPHNRTQENEADLIGEDLMAQAGFDPQESVDLWQNMMAQGSSRPPQWLSSHPAEESRIEALKKRMPVSKQLYQQAGVAGNRPSCGTLTVR